MRAHLAVLAVVSAAVLNAASAATPHRAGEFTVLHADGHAITFEYRPQFGPTREIVAEGQTFTAFAFSGATLLDPAAQPGAPALLCRRVPLSFPSVDGNRVELVSADYEDVRGVVLPPVPFVASRDGLNDAPRYTPDASAFRTAGLSPAAPVQMGRVNTVRSIHAGAVVLVPLQCDFAARTVRRYTRMVVTVTYGAAGVLAANHPDKALLGPGLLNGIVASSVPTLKRSTAIASSVLKTGRWWRIAVNDDGVYKLDATTLAAAGVPTASIDPRQIKIYGNGGTEMPENIAVARPVDLLENAIYVEGESDGKFDTGDYVLFYGRSVRSWRYVPANRRIEHAINHYGETNYYWLTVDGAVGKRMAAQASVTDPAGTAPAFFRDGVAMENEKLKIATVSSGKDWYAQLLDAKTASITYVFPLPGLVPGNRINYRIRLLSHTYTGATFTIREGGFTLGVIYEPQLNPGGYLYASDEIYETSATSTLSANTSQLGIAYTTGGTGDEGYVDWVELNYPRFFFANNEYLRFWGPDTTAVVEYQLQQFAATPWIFNVTSPSNVARITGFSGSPTFRAREAQGSISEYVAASPAAWKAPASIQAVSNQDLRGFATGADFIIVTSSEFRQAADRLAAYREQPAHGDLRTLVVQVDQIYNEFGGGIADITAIRDYLKYAYDNWTRKPQFVLFLGQASYDYKGILGSKTSYVPTWQSPNSSNDVESYNTDDYFAKFGAGDGISLAIGRIPARSLSEAMTVVEKSIGYEDGSVRDPWRMRIAFVADDAWTSEGGDIGDRTLHSDQAEDLADNHTPVEFEEKKIYLAEYPTVTSATGRSKPGVFSEIINQINQGVLILNFTGHGNPLQLAHENVFNVQTSIPQLVNADRLALFMLATCNFSQYDDPRRYSGGELLINKPDGGAVGVLSASRKVFADQNASLNQGVYDRMFPRDTLSRLMANRPAVALYLYKVTGNYQNDQKYCFLGDPTLRLQFPSGYATIDSINGLAVKDYASSSTPIQLRSLSKVTIRGAVRKPDGSIDGAYTGKVVLVVNDAGRVQTIVDFYPGVNWSYEAMGGVIFKGVGSVTAGRFSMTFVVPKDISYAEASGRGRVVAYYSNATSDGEGFAGVISVNGTDSTAVDDRTGPALSVFLNTRDFRAGDMVGEHPTLIVDVADSSGINTSGTGIGHRIEAWLNAATQSTDLTGFYTSTLDDYRRGSVQVPLQNLVQGRNTIRVRAWDSFNNSNAVESFFTVASNEALTIEDVMNYPNPFSSGTAFVFRQNRTDPLAVKIRIYTVAGRLIQTLETTTGGEPYVRLPWDGRDRDGDLLANGVYFYKVLVRTTDGQYSSESLGKLVVMK